MQKVVYDGKESKMADSDILKVTHISKEKLEELKLQKV